MLIKTKIGPSAIEGIGVFADQFVPAGTIVWELTPGLDGIYSVQEFQEMKTKELRNVIKYVFLSRDTNRYILCNDYARFFNHSDVPNCLSQNINSKDKEGITIALQDIQIGEELTDDYKSFDASFGGLDAEID